MKLTNMILILTGLVTGILFLLYAGTVVQEELLAALAGLWESLCQQMQAEWTAETILPAQLLRLPHPQHTMPSEEVLGELCLGIERNWMEDTFGSAQPLGRRGAYELVSYTCGAYTIEAAYDKENVLQAYVLSAEGAGPLPFAQRTFRSAWKKHSPETAHAPQKPVQSVGYIRQGHTTAAYAESYTEGKQTSSYSYSVASLDCLRQMGDLEPGSRPHHGELPVLKSLKAPRSFGNSQAAAENQTPRIGTGGRGGLPDIPEGK